MTDLEQLLVRDLEARADRVPVGPVPLDAVVRQAAVRRRRPWVVLGAAAAVVVVAAGLVVGLPSNTAPEPRRPTEPMATPTPAPTPATRTVGIAHVTIDVPAGWPTQGRCERPRVDAVVPADRWGTCRAWSVEAGVETVMPIDVDPRSPGDATPIAELHLAGVPALRSAVLCETSDPPTCGGWIWVPSQGAGFRVESRTDGAAVDALLDTVRVDPTLVAVPAPVPFSGLAFTYGMYRDFGKSLGLSVTIPPGLADRPWEFGRTRVAPPVGTRVAPGTLVHVTRRP